MIGHLSYTLKSYSKIQKTSFKFSETSPFLFTLFFQIFLKYSPTTFLFLLKMFTVNFHRLYAARSFVQYLQHASEKYCRLCGKYVANACCMLPRDRGKGSDRSSSSWGRDKDCGSNGG